MLIVGPKIFFTALDNHLDRAGPVCAQLRYVNMRHACPHLPEKFRLLDSNLLFYFTFLIT